MTTSTYIRPMNFGEWIRSTLRIYAIAFWPFWAIVILIFFTLDQLYIAYWSSGSATNEIINLLLLGFALLPVFFVGSAMLTISNIVLARPKKTLTSFTKGMSLGMILKIFLFLSPLLILMLIIGLRAGFNFWPWSYLMFTVPFLFFTPVWVFYPMILLLEKKSFFESIRRTKTFISGQIKRLLQIQILLILLTVLVIPLGIKYYLIMYHQMPFFELFRDFAAVGFGYSEKYQMNGLFFLADRIAGGLYYVVPLVLGFGICAYVLHYYQVRAEKENFNEELLTQELGYQPMEEMMTV